MIKINGFIQKAHLLVSIKQFPIFKSLLDYSLEFSKGNHSNSILALEKITTRNDMGQESPNCKLLMQLIVVICRNQLLSLDHILAQFWQIKMCIVDEFHLLVIFIELFVFSVEKVKQIFSNLRQFRVLLLHRSSLLFV